MHISTFYYYYQLFTQICFKYLIYLIKSLRLFSSQYYMLFRKPTHKCFPPTFCSSQFTPIDFNYIWAFLLFVVIQFNFPQITSTRTCISDLLMLFVAKWFNQIMKLNLTHFIQFIVWLPNILFHLFVFLSSSCVLN